MRDSSSGVLMMESGRLIRTSLLTLWGLACACGGTTLDSATEGATDGRVDVARAPIVEGVPCSTPPAAPEVGELGEPVTELGACEPADVLPPDPLVFLESALTLRDPVNDIETAAFVSHIIDLDVDPSTGFVYVASLPGFFVFGPSEDGFRHLGSYPARSPMGSTSWQQGEPLYGEVVEYAHVAWLGDDIVAATARGNPPPEFMFGPDHPGIYGLFLLDVSVPSDIRLVGELEIADLAGVAHVEPYLYTLSYMGELLVVNVSDRAAPEVVGSMTGLGNPWKLVVVGEYAYVADTKLGLVVVDLGDPMTPRIVATVPTASGLQDVAHDGGVVYGAAGAAGVEFFSIAEPALPVCLASVQTGPSAVGVAASDGLLWVTNHEGVLVFDVSEPTAPLPWAVEATDGWALHAFAHGDEAYIADWEFIHHMRVSREDQAPEADVNPEALYFWDALETRQFSIRNRGSVDLVVHGLAVPDSRVTVALSRTVIPSGETATADVTFADDGEPLDTTLCIATNDPDEPLRQLRVARTSPYGDSSFHKFHHEGDGESAVTVGQMVPDFVLPDLDGNLRQLSDQIGRPVLLMFFSTW